MRRINYELVYRGEISSYYFRYRMHRRIICAAVGAPTSKKMNDIQSFAIFSQAAGKIEKVMVIPGMAAILVFGVILGLIGHSPILGFLQGAQQNWLLVSNILLLAHR